jgi:ABC-2 type transport system ATP-binding protein
MLRAENLTKRYDDFTALNALQLHIEAGEIYCLLGANGAGKSTTIHLFLGFIEPTEGNCWVGGLKVSENKRKIKQFVAYIPENLMLYPHLSGIENVAYFSALADKKYTHKELADFLNQAGLQPEAHQKRVSYYSKGMRQKVGIAIALAKNAKALLLDEPTSGLDPQASNEFSQLLLGLKARKMAILMATHDLFRAKQVATQIGIMKAGRLEKSYRESDISLQELENRYLEIINTH